MNVSIEQKVQQKSKKPNDEADIITENTLISNLEERRSKSNKTLVRQISMKEINLEDPGLWSVKILNLSSCSNINRKGTVYQVKNLDFPISKSGRKFSKHIIFDNYQTGNKYFVIGLFIQFIITRYIVSAAKFLVITVIISQINVDFQTGNIYLSF